MAQFSLSSSAMNDELLQTLKALPTDPGRVVDLYSQLYAGLFVVPVQAGSEADIGTAMFLIYPTPDGVSELPLFTSHDYVLRNLPNDVAFVSVPGAVLWPRLFDVVKAAGRCMAAVDPGQTHGIRLSDSMILGMISSYSQKPSDSN
jgi:hypothetical protein